MPDLGRRPQIEIKSELLQAKENQMSKTGEEVPQAELPKAEIPKSVKLKLKRKDRKFKEKYMDESGYLKPLGEIKSFNAEEFQKAAQESNIKPQFKTENKGRSK